MDIFIICDTHVCVKWIHMNKSLCLVSERAAQRLTRPRGLHLARLQSAAQRFQHARAHTHTHRKGGCVCECGGEAAAAVTAVIKAAETAKTCGHISKNTLLCV